MTDLRVLWPKLIQAALRFNITPVQFWRLSVREWRLLNTAPGADALSRSSMDKLMKTFPDGVRNG